MMTKRGFIALADAIRDVKPMSETECRKEGANPKFRLYRDGRRTQWDVTLERMANFCTAQNPRFDRAWWLGLITNKQ